MAVTEVRVADAVIRLAEAQQPEAFAPIFSDAWTGSRVWNAAYALVGLLCRRAKAGGLAGKRCVELGAGPGLCGLAASALGAASVLLTDQSVMVEMLRRNIALNPGLRGVVAAELDWASAALHAGQQYDIVLVSDCVNEIYGAGSFAQLAGAIRALTAPGGTCLLAHEERSVGVATPAFVRFRALCAARGLSVTRLHSDGSGDAADGRIQLYELELPLEPAPS